MAEYLRNPQWIEAWQVTKTNAEDLAEMLGLQVNYRAGSPTGAVEFRYWDRRYHEEGVCNVHPGDYIFRLPGGPFDFMHKEEFEFDYTEIRPHD